MYRLQPKEKLPFDVLNLTKEQLSKPNVIFLLPSHNPSLAHKLHSQKIVFPFSLEVNLKLLIAAKSSVSVIITALILPLFQTQGSRICVHMLK
jgi:hypothetical protein